MNWLQIAENRLALFGHRNWIVIADAAYPAQSAAGIEIVAADTDLLNVLSLVLARVDAAPHVIAAAYMDRELALVPEVDAPGVTSCAAAISQQLGGHGIRELPHEEIIAKLDEAARMFRVLIIKTQSTIPYTSVFLELGCGYWAPQAEARLRARMAQMV